MGEVTSYGPFLQQYGVAALLFIVFYMYHKAVTEQQNKVIDRQAEREKENFNLLKEMISINYIQNGLLEKIHSEIINNQWCPYVKKFISKGEINEPSNNAT